ncbi:MAG TPA: hypothetical protein VND93_07610 [Myxococcales bacterium]|nr:hypothetical protein [Myxococcales bacterium]
MKLGLICENKSRFDFSSSDPEDINSELLSIQEEDELLSGFRDAGHEVALIRDAQDLLNRIGYWRKHCELVFNQSTGYRGDQNGMLAPAILEAAGIPYVGSPPYVHGLARDKHLAKLVIAALTDVRTPPAVLVTGAEPEALARLPYPAIVKPVRESSSVGIQAGRSVVPDAAAAMARARELIQRYRQPALVETFVPGVEIEVPVLLDPSPRPLGAVAVTLQGKVVSGNEYLTSTTVYGDGYGFAAPPDQVDAGRVLAAAARATAALGIRDYGRIDLRVAEDGTPWFIEADALPHIQRHSSFYTLAQRRGLAYHQMLDELIAVALSRTRSRH